jgi:hypothetical protein
MRLGLRNTTSPPPARRAADRLDWMDRDRLDGCGPSPDQYLPRRDHVGSGERRLVLAVVDDVACVLQRARSTDRDQAVEDALRWVHSTDRTWPFSFENCCLWLGWDPGFVRAGLLDIHRRRHMPQGNAGCEAGT